MENENIGLDLYSPIVNTNHRILLGDARDRLTELDDNSVELVVTSPPYPMIAMWDDVFDELSGSNIEYMLRTADEDSGTGFSAFDSMHEVLTDVWRELARVVVPGGTLCINIGDALRSFGDQFQCYPNAAMIVDYFHFCWGWRLLPSILWHKSTNSPSKFMGSGMKPPNAYVTQEHEHILVFRNGSNRVFTDAGSRGTRDESAYFFEERNQWFSDRWEIAGESQYFDSSTDRQRTGAYPFEIPYRLINMYSIYGDTVLDPFWGTGTTTLAAMVTGRSSIGIEIDEAVTESFADDVIGVQQLSARHNLDRLSNHEWYVTSSESTQTLVNKNYGFPVTSGQERDIRLYNIDSIDQTSTEAESETVYDVSHSPLEYQTDLASV
jgi:DNA modification methylase